VAYGVLYQEIFQSRGHQVKLTFDGQECLKEYFAAPKSYDMVILDYHMPKTNGLDVAKEIFSKTPNQNVCFISSFGDELESEIADLGWGKKVQFVEKPFSSDGLIKKVERQFRESGQKITA
jgi:two-component system cell cycle response regulator CpdR